MVVYKYELSVNSSTTEVKMPFGAKLLRVDGQGSKICLWAMVDPNAQEEKRTIGVYGTGHDIADDGKSRIFINTFLLQGGAYVFHAFEIV